MSVVTLHTTHGDITLELDAAKAPATVASFLGYASSGFYAGTIFLFHALFKHILDFDNFL